MAYLGRQPVIGNFVKLDAITAVNGQAAYTMQNGSVNFTDYSTVNQFLISLNGTIQSPGSSFTVSGSTLTFASNLSTGDVIDFVMCFGNSLSAGTPTDGTVTAAKLNDDIISGQTALASEPADTDEFLVSDAGTLKRIDYSLIKGGGITEADQWRLTTSFTGDADPIASNLSRTSSYGAGYLGTGMTQSSGIFTFPSTGIWQILWTLRVEMSTGYRHQMNLKTTLDNSSYNVAAYIRVNGSASQGDNQATASQSFLFDVTDTSLCKCQFQIVDESGSNNNTTQGNANYNLTCMSFIRLGDT